MPGALFLGEHSFFGEQNEAISRTQGARHILSGAWVWRVFVL